MTKLLIETTGVDFGFDKQKLAIQNLNLMVPDGSIYGFLGPNGAGKTTSIRLILGLLRPAVGRIQILGKSLSDNRLAIYSQIGALIETPSLYSHLTGYDNLKITCKITKVNTNRIHEVLRMVNLTDVASMLVKKYSLGMKQRLGIALALLSEPKLLILDEPTNGLDPNGMIETRELLLDLNKNHGVTLVVSSHLLSEIEKLISHVGIIKNGSLIFQDRIEKLKDIRYQNSVIQIKTGDNAKALTVLRDQFQVRLVNDECLEANPENKEQVALMCRILATHDISLYGLNVMNDDLESKFFEILRN